MTVVVAHSGDPFAKAELALHFLLVYVVLSLTGAGKFSLDHFIANKLNKSKNNLYKQNNIK